MNIEVVEEETDTDFLHQPGIGGRLLLRFVSFQFIDNFLSKVQFNGVNEFIIMSHGAEELLFVEVLFVHRRLRFK